MTVYRAEAGPGREFGTWQDGLDKRGPFSPVTYQHKTTTILGMQDLCSWDAGSRWTYCNRAANIFAGNKADTLGDRTATIDEYKVIGLPLLS